MINQWKKNDYHGNSKLDSKFKFARSSICNMDDRNIHVINVNFND